MRRARELPLRFSAECEVLPRFRESNGYSRYTFGRLFYNNLGFAAAAVASGGSGRDAEHLPEGAGRED